MLVSPVDANNLEQVIDFVNTLDVETDTDALATPAELAAWLGERGLLEAGAARLGEPDRERAVELREALRAMMLANNGGARDERAIRVLERTARGGELGVHFGTGGDVVLAPAAGGLSGALARLLVPVAGAIADGSWRRAKACRAQDCAWAFYDRSRNRSGVWCEMAVCGNRTKVRAYRERAPRGG
jgi:predicted RNA-binding Zn ribbon-like protein